MNRQRTVSGSHVTDRAIFGAIMLIMFCTAPRLLVYHRSLQVGTIRLELAAIDADGTRVELAVPPGLEGGKVRAVLAGIRAFAKTPRAHTLTPPAGHLEWTLRYAVANGTVTYPQFRVLITEDSPRR